MVKTELKRAIFTKSFLSACGTAFFMLMIGGYQYVEDFLSGYTTSGVWADKYIFSLSIGRTSILCGFVPIVVIIPYVLSYRKERDSGFRQLMILKGTRRAYVRAKLLAVACSGFLSMFLSNLCWLLVCRICFGTGEIINPRTDLFLEVFERSPFGYGMIYVLNVGLVGAVFALLALGLTAVIRNRYLAVLLPFCYGVFSAAILSRYWEALNAIWLVSIELPRDRSYRYGTMLLYDLVLAVIGCVLFVGGDRIAGKA